MFTASLKEAETFSKQQLRDQDHTEPSGVLYTNKDCDSAKWTSRTLYDKDMSQRTGRGGADCATGSTE
jgi:hypothetical protein